MFSKSSLTTRILLISLFSLSFFTRFYKFNWGDGYFFHPDENNIAVAITKLSPSNLNPHFFAYGQFPIYLSYFSLSLARLPNTFPHAIYALRLWSAFFSLLSLPLIYLIALQVFRRQEISIIALVFSIFNPGLIELAHFGTTESLLIFTFLSIIFLSSILVEKLRPQILIAIGAFLGVAIGTKISSAIFVVPIFVSWIYFLLKTKRIIPSFFFGFIFIILTIAFTIISSPYNLIDRADFLSSMNYETRVATGAIKVFYTSQFLFTHPYLFPLVRIFPYVNGFPVFLYSIIGFFLVFKLSSKSRINLLIVFISVLAYFLYYGQIYIKWTRFMSPVFFVFPILAAVFVSIFSRKYLKIVLIFLGILPGLFFLNIYLRPDIRVQASQWISSHIPAGSHILSEGGNVIDIPIGDARLDVLNFDFYSYDHHPEKISLLAQELLNSEYIFIPSRRVFKNQNNQEFPQSQCYYQQLFSGQLGFQPHVSFSPQNELIEGENAEETWTVFDRPTVRIYKKTVPLSLPEYQRLLQCQTKES